MATLTRKTIAAPGTSFALAAADVAGDSVLWASGAKLLVVNGSASDVDVTLASEATASLGLAVTDVVVTVTAGQTGVIPLESVYRDSTTGLVSWTYDAVTTVTVAVI